MFPPLAMPSQADDIFEKPAEERRVLLLAAEILRAEIIQIGAVGQRVLRDEINVAAVEILDPMRLVRRAG